MQSPNSPNTPESAFSPSLVELSRQASVFSSSSSDGGESDSVSSSSPRRALARRKYEGPRTARSPLLPASARRERPPSFLTKELGGSVSPRRQHRNSRSRSDPARLNDFAVGGTLGRGSFSTVSLAMHYRTSRKFAVKAVDRNNLERNRKSNSVWIEKAALTRLGDGHPGIVHLHHFFEDTWCYYFVLDWAPNGELQGLIAHLGSLSPACSRYYAAQIIDAVSYMHSKGIIHRDLKPENILLDGENRIKITDFGTAVVQHSELEPDKFAGTAQYMAPEQIEKNESSRSSDIWSIGCVIYHMLAGRYPFSGFSVYLVMEKVKDVNYVFPAGFDIDGRDLVERMLVHDPHRRLGGGDCSDEDLSMSALRAHPFFDHVDWDTLWTDPVPPLRPGLVKNDGHDKPRQITHDAFEGIPWAEDALDSSSESDTDSDDLLSPVHTPESSPESGSPAKTHGLIHSLKTLSINPVKFTSR